MPVLDPPLRHTGTLPRHPINTSDTETEDMAFGVNEDYLVPVASVVWMTLAMFAAVLLAVLF